MDRYLMILEVSQKQAYIFGSNVLKDNVRNSAMIAYVTGKDFFNSLAAGNQSVYSEENNLVYSGGGHTILDFASLEQARAFSGLVTGKVLADYPDMELFVKVKKYDESLSYSQNLKELISELEKKKSLRIASFHQGTYGIEHIDPATKKPVISNLDKEVYTGAADSSDLDRLFIPQDYEAAMAFSDLGGTKGKSNYIAVVHIDGNGMGNRVNKKYQDLDKECNNWEAFKKEVRVFSEKIDTDYKTAYRRMTEIVAEQDRLGALRTLSLRENKKTGKPYFPIRRIITSGDDICFVTDGRIGIESAVAFIRELRRIDKSYSACAGVAIVHQKYPFFKAYELAESLCSNAKKFNATIAGEREKGNQVSSIDWHIDQGEIEDSAEEVRNHYISEDGKYHLEMRPYIIDGPLDIVDDNRNKPRNYSVFKKLIVKLMTGSDNDNDDVSKGKIKNLRGVLKQGEAETMHYVNFYKLWESFIENPDQIFVRTKSGEKHAKYFDAIELVDTFIPFVELNGGE